MFTRNRKGNVLPCSAHYTDKPASYQISQLLYAILRDELPGLDVAFFCIGSDRATGDALGPLVGTKLKRLLPNACIRGTLEHPVHAGNLETELHSLCARSKSPLVIAIDACLGAVGQIGYIKLASGALQPGSAVRKKLPAVGDYHLTGIVNVGGFCESLVLQSTRLHFVLAMADTIAYLVASAFFQLQREEKARPAAPS
jgi:putative sporulation protein YyaC